MPAKSMRGLPLPAPPGTPPSVPQFATATGKDSGATVSWYPPATAGSSPIVSYTITPYLGGVAQAATTVPVGSVNTISLTTTYMSINATSFNSPLSASSALQTPVTGLTNGSSYTFTVKATNATSTSVESAQTGAALPLSGLVFGDEFAGSAGGPIDPFWWIYDRAGDTSSPHGYYKASQLALDGNSNIVSTCVYNPYTGNSYPSWPGGVQSVTLPYRCGGMHANQTLFMPTAGNTLTIEGKFQTCSAISSGGQMHVTVWTHGSGGQQEWKVDPEATTINEGYDLATSSDVSMFEWGDHTGDTSNTWWFVGFNTGGTTENYQFPAGATDFSAAEHVYTYNWKPSVSRSITLDGTLKHSTTTNVPTTPVFFLWWMEVEGDPGPSPGFGTQIAKFDYVRVYDRNLG